MSEIITIKINDLDPLVESLADTDVLALYNTSTGKTVKLTAAVLKEYAGGSELITDSEITVTNVTQGIYEPDDVIPAGTPITDVLRGMLVQGTPIVLLAPLATIAAVGTQPGSYAPNTDIDADFTVTFTRRDGGKPNQIDLTVGQTVLSADETAISDQYGPAYATDPVVTYTFTQADHVELQTLINGTGGLTVSARVYYDAGNPVSDPDGILPDATLPQGNLQTNLLNYGVIENVYFKYHTTVIAGSEDIAPGGVADPTNIITEAFMLSGGISGYSGSITIGPVAPTTTKSATYAVAEPNTLKSIINTGSGFNEFATITAQGRTKQIVIQGQTYNVYWINYITVDGAGPDVVYNLNF